MFNFQKERNALRILIILLFYSMIIALVSAFIFPIISIVIILLWITSFISIMVYDRRHWRKPDPESHGIWLSNQTRNLNIGEYSIHGAVMGSCVKARNIFSASRAELRSLIGGEAQQFTGLVDECRNMALGRMCLNAKKKGCNGVLGFRIVTSETLWGATEVIAYGTAVKIESVVEK